MVEKQKKNKWHPLTHSSTGEEGGPSAHGVDVTLWRQTWGPMVRKAQNEPKTSEPKFTMFVL